MNSWESWNAGSLRERDDVQACKAAVRTVMPDAQVILYGSRARGEAHSESDFDILVVSPDRVSSEDRQALNDVMLDVELDRDILISCLVCSRDVWDASPWRAAPLHANVERDGVAL